MTSPAPRHQSPGNDSTPRDAGQIGLIVLVVLAVIASIVMLISGSDAALKLALIAALWAAVLGFFLVVRYRRQAEESQTKLELQERAHRAELDAANAAAGEAGGSQGAAPSNADMEILAEIREQLSTIRSQLEELSGREYTYEPAALRAEARRIMELEAQTRAPPVSQRSTSLSPAPVRQPPMPSLVASVPSREHRAPRTIRLNDIISEKIRRDKEETPTQASTPKKPEPKKAEPKKPAAPKAEAKKTEAKKPEPKKAETKQPEKKTAPKPKQSQPKQPSKPSFDTGSFQAVRWDAGGDETAKFGAVKEKTSASKHRAPADGPAPVQPKPQQPNRGIDKKQAEKAASQHAEAKQESTRSGRRRSDAHRKGAVTVAELLAQRKKDN
ncbi:Hypothetical protein NG00_01797 [Corynebacterium camporealensis]|uniref:DUF6779 domain-containing protein n=1 Tax=Corynebacterium camporealensis TaxID=161896 RepID=UPI000D22B3C8|nr:DUF6779 domain-containing protein [Corynebacterium camporealensis]AVH89036.1 Hypothetical protein NG00_01797 [Corynebacterium camporealensis]